MDSSTTDQETSPMLIEDPNGPKKSMGKKITLVSLVIIVFVGISIGVSGCSKKRPAHGEYKSSKPSKPEPTPAPPTPAPPEPTPAPPAGPTKLEGSFYSNTKYLGDFGVDSGVDLDSCTKMCAGWDTGVCDDKCKEKKACLLSDDVDAKFHTRDVSCKTKCTGFNMHGDDRCTLFASDVKLRKSSHDGNTFYKMPVAEDEPAEEEKEEPEEETENEKEVEKDVEEKTKETENEKEVEKDVEEKTKEK